MEETLQDIIEVLSKLDGEPEETVLTAAGWGLRKMFGIAKKLNINLNKAVSYGAAFNKDENGDLYFTAVDNGGGIEALKGAAERPKINRHNPQEAAEINEHITMAGIFLNEILRHIGERTEKEIEALLGHAAWCLEMVLTLHNCNIQIAVSKRVKKNEIFI